MHAQTLVPQPAVRPATAQQRGSRPSNATVRAASNLHSGQPVKRGARGTGLLRVIEQALGRTAAPSLDVLGTQHAAGPATQATAQSGTTQSFAEEQGSGEEGSAGGPKLDVLTRLQNNLLNNAASLRTVRSQSTCVRCLGKGRMACTACQGAGVKAGGRSVVRMNQIKHAAGKVKAMMGLQGGVSSDNDWMMTNRCRRCHGTGVCSCPVCEGRGRLGPSH